MSAYTANWEDEENNRIVELLVDYSVNDEKVAIDNVTPKTVTFVEAESKEIVRQIGVWTDKGRSHLLSKFEEIVGLDSLHTEISNSLFATA